MLVTLNALMQDKYARIKVPMLSPKALGLKHMQDERN
jgi:hypothetical protein